LHSWGLWSSKGFWPEFPKKICGGFVKPVSESSCLISENHSFFLFVVVFPWIAT
jgi:hypothetical protein